MMSNVDGSGDLDRAIGLGGVACGLAGRKAKLANLRRKRIYTQRQLAKWEPILADLQAKLEATEAAIQAIAPELRLPPRFHRQNPIFPKGDMTRMVLGILREAIEPLSNRMVVMRLLAAKGIAMPDRTLRKRTQHSLSAALSVLHKRGVVVMEGGPNKRVWRLESQHGGN